MVKACERANRQKAAIIKRRLGLPDDDPERLRAPSVSELVMFAGRTDLFVVDPTADCKLLVPVPMFRIADTVHIMKNAEVAAFSKALGSGVHPANGRYLKSMQSAVLFQFARLFSSSREFREIIRMYCPAAQMLATVPGVVVHRLKIKPLLARLVMDYLPAILQALASFNLAFGRSVWKNSSRQTTMTHAQEVRGWC